MELLNLLKTTYLSHQIVTPTTIKLSSKQQFNYLSDLWAYLFKTYGKKIGKPILVLILGPKGAGKSTLLYKIVQPRLDNGRNHLFIRNTDLELKNFKTTYLNMWHDKGYSDFKLSGNKIKSNSSPRIYCQFMSAKNYKEISSLILPHTDITIHDEFNQSTPFNSDFVENVINGTDTTARENDRMIIACGNNQTANNPYFNFLKFEAEPLNNNLGLVHYVKDDYLIIEYKRDLFLKAGNPTWIKWVAKHNPQLAQKYYTDGDYQDALNFVLNNWKRITSLEKVHYVIWSSYGPYAYCSAIIDGQLKTIFLKLNPKWEINGIRQFAVDGSSSIMGGRKVKLDYDYLYQVLVPQWVSGLRNRTLLYCDFDIQEIINLEVFGESNNWSVAQQKIKNI